MLIYDLKYTVLCDLKYNAYLCWLFYTQPCEMSWSVDRADLSTFEQRKRTVLKDITTEANDKSPKGSLDAPIVELIQIINQCPDIYTTSSCSGRVTLFLENHERKGGSWLYLSHAVTDYQTVCE